MTKRDIPVSSRQILYLTLVIFVPLLLAAGVIVWTPAKPGQSDSAVAFGIVGAISALLLGMVIAAMKRHAIELTRDALVIRHSLYTLLIERNSVTSASVREVTSVDQLGLSTRKNGIAAFGYFSGWFRGAHGDLTFCAISKRPLHVIAFEGSAKCRRLAISASPEVARSIAAWSAGAM